MIALRIHHLGLHWYIISIISNKKTRQIWQIAYTTREEDLKTLIEMCEGWLNHDGKADYKFQNNGDTGVQIHDYDNIHRNCGDATIHQFFKWCNENYVEVI